MTKRQSVIDPGADIGQPVSVVDAPDSIEVDLPSEPVAPQPVAALPSEQIAAEIVALEDELAELANDQATTSQQIAERWHGDASNLASEYSQRAARIVGGKARLGLLKQQHQEAQKAEALAKYDNAIHNQAEYYVQVAVLEDVQAALRAQINDLTEQFNELAEQGQLIRGRAEKAHKQAIALGISPSELMGIYKQHVGRSRHM